MLANLLYSINNTRERNNTLYRLDYQLPFARKFQDHSTPQQKFQVTPSPGSQTFH